MKRILLLVNNKRKINKNKKICVVGVSPKSGVTHICLCMANFISSVLHQKVIYIELRKESQLLSLVGQKQVKVGNVLGYEYMGVKYILSASVESVSNIMLTEDAWIIVDMEDITEETKTIFKNCNNKMVLGSLSPWCQREYYDFIENKIIKYDTNTVTFYVNNKNEKSKIKFDKMVGCNSHFTPYINDPFSLKEKDFEKIINMIR